MRFQPYPATMPMITVPVDGEILHANPPTDTFPYYTYDVLIQIPQGTKTLVTNAVTSNMFGGPFDYFQMRRRATADATTPAPASPGTALDKYTIGDRVVIIFLQGDARKPLIIGGMPHPRMGLDLPTEEDKPQARLSYLGMTFDVDPLGEFEITHRGNPTNSDLASPVASITDPTKFSYFRMKDEGSISLGDSFKQSITLTVKESIKLGNPTSSLEISLKDSKITLDTKTDFKVSAKLSATLSAGSNTLKLDSAGQSIELSSAGTLTLKAAQKASVSAPQGISLEAGIAKLTMKNGQVALGTSTFEIFEAFGILLQEMLSAAPTFVATPTGPGILNPGLLTKITELLTKIKLVKGSL